MRRALVGGFVLAFSAALCAAATVVVDDVGDGRTGAGTVADPYRDLQTAIDAAADGDVLAILPGTYAARTVAFVELLCGNCEVHRSPVQATRGFLVSGKALRLEGSGRDATTLVTNAGYGILFEGSGGSSVSSLTITGGKRDPDGSATDAAVVVRKSTVTLQDLDIVDNTDRVEDVVVGIGGVMGREGAEIFIIGNVIRNNGWDGVALYRGATAFIADNQISVGRGAGIGITWDAVATVLRNRISGYWKGIGSFGSSRAVVRNNAVFDNLGWGIIATGTSFMEAANNVIARNGNCGFALWSEEATAVVTNNIIVENGWREEWVCPQVGVWLAGERTNLDFTANDVWKNVAGDFRDLEGATGADGNISLDPVFSDSLDFHLRPGSPCIDAGNPIFTDPDGGPADLGIYGGPAAR
jgi:hypothetical protein